MGAADAASVAERGLLMDGTPWPVPVTFEVPADAVPADARHVVLQDQEGSPLAVLSVAERRAVFEPADPGEPARVRLAGPVTALREPEHGPFRQLRRRPEDVRSELSGGTVLAYATWRPLNKRHIGQLRHYAGQLNARLLLLPLVAGRADVVTRPEALVRAVLAARQHLPAGTLVIPVPLARRPAGPGADLRAQAIVAAAYGATHLLADASEVPDPAGSPGGIKNGTLALPGVPIPVINAGEWAYDPRSEVWRPLALIETGAEQGELTDSELGALLDSGGEVPGWFAPPSVARELRRARPPRAERGLAIFFTGLSGSGKSTIARGLAEALTELLDAGGPVPSWLMPEGVTAELRRARPPRSARGIVVFFTGLSGSGKSTLARDLRDALLERGDRTVSLLDGDLVRRLLSAGLTFSREDRDLNIARIGYVATEVARHGGIAICAPIAPYAAARSAVRSQVSEVGDFVLVHVSTPLAVCEARDRKGLYAKARAGVIGSFTGISDPYEEPTDADLVLDTSLVSRRDAVAAVLAHLSRGGWLS